MIKYRSTTFLSLLLPYLLLGVIPSQGTIETNNSYHYYWKEGLTGNGNLKNNDNCETNKNYDWFVATPGTLTYTGNGNLNDAMEALNREFELICGYVRELSGESIYEKNILDLILANMRFSIDRLDLRKASNMNGFDNIRVDFLIKKRVELSASLDDDHRKYISDKLEYGGWTVDSIRKNQMITKSIEDFSMYEDDEEDEYDDDIYILKDEEEEEEKMEQLKEEINELIRKGANLNEKTKDIYSPLRMAIKRKIIGIVTFLIDKGADVNAIDDWGSNPLLEAVFRNSVEIVALLIKNKVEVNRSDANRDSSLFLAARKGYVDIITLLLKSGADPNLKNKYGDTPLDIAKKENQREIIALLEKALQNIQ